MTSSTRKRSLTAVLALGFAMGIIASSMTNHAWSEVRSTPQRAPVPSGGLQSLSVLRDIAATLKSIDARLARSEATLQRLAAQGEQSN